MVVAATNGTASDEAVAKRRKLESLERLPRMAVEKYRSFQAWYQIPFDDKWKQRKWPSERIVKAPRWCSVDLRDGNQALQNPMNHDKKLSLFLHLLKLGYTEIEVGFPSASQTDFDFLRYIIDNGLIPDGVWIQVLTQCRESLIDRTIEGVRGAKNVVLHIYNSTSELQRRVVFKKGREDIKQLAVEGTQLLRKLADEKLQGANVRLEYSPESFTGTELDFALDVCEAVMDVWGATPQNQVILNLPSTVEMATPNVYADQIEWMCAHLTRRDCVCVSVHPHNDRGTGIAAAELALMAGADRVEGCLFGNGERTGNVCLVTLALNMFTQGIDPEVSYTQLDQTIKVSEFCTELRIPERYPWAGSLVYTAFSGSHQDAIKKGLDANKGAHWEVPYLPIDPQDIGRHYEAIIRVNSQSGKGGIAYLLEVEYGITIPKECQAEFAQAPSVKSYRQDRQLRNRRQLKLVGVAAAAITFTAMSVCFSKAVAAVAVPALPQLSDRIFLVTGSTDGIGKFTAEQLALQGCTVLVHGRTAAKIDSTLQELQRMAPQAKLRGYQADLSQMSEVRRLASEVAADFPALHGLLNNAGTFDGDYTGRRQETAEGNEYSLAVNVMAPFLLTSLLLPNVRASGAGRIVCTSSYSMGSGDLLGNLQLKTGWSGHCAYSLSKLCDAMITMEMHDRYGDAPRLCFHTMDPGTVDTKMLRAGWWHGGTSVRTAKTSFRILTEDSFQAESGQCLCRGDSEVRSKEKRARLWDDLEHLTGAKLLGRTWLSGLPAASEREGGVGLADQLREVVQKITDSSSSKISAKQIYDAFVSNYLTAQEPLSLIEYSMSDAKASSGDGDGEGEVHIKAKIRVSGKECEITGQGNGPVSAFLAGLNQAIFEPQGTKVHLSDYQSVARSACRNAEGSEAVCSVRCQAVQTSDGGTQGKPKFGVGLHKNTTTAVLRAVISGVNGLAATGTCKLFA
ncbi:unnamed protein product [Polarella glacialis]|uniref:2-isopropylmalate synthase n=1 Tax=Polarella glacialis TaxID=89957 RepID=A0A813KEH8_POLGL|nr:unnamed protein product [Polarella glacialis]